MSNRREFFQVAALGAAGVTLSSRAEAASPGYVISPAAIPSLPVIGTTDRFPVRRIYCIGMNYQAHVDEDQSKVAQGREAFKAPPFYFLKSPDMIVQNNSKIDYPLLTKDFHYELEMVVALKSGGKNIAKAQALDCVYGYAVGLDMTRRDLQGEALNNKMPWEPGKSFDQSAPCSAITPVSKIGHMNKGHIQLKVNDKVEQVGDVSSLILDVPAIIAFLSKSYELRAGDIIYTGTLAGSGPVVSGDRMVGTIDKLEPLTITVA